ncbi:hypothetical protein Pmani_022827 [Petrolisthes manimaculis]|uniref:Uncharacterized protein n=1 Tax=Petrolisthes manimaculis TaxID=1843537 RepID=A0AAE1U0S5_9EUCA|nr:hypothetical protein Pmani_022827 [Petrolisthes manimaculis]
MAAQTRSIPIYQISQHTLTCTPSCSSADAGGFSQQHDENPPIQELDESEICPSSGVGSQQDAESESQQDNGWPRQAVLLLI